MADHDIEAASDRVEPVPPVLPVVRPTPGSRRQNPGAPLFLPAADRPRQMPEILTGLFVDERV
jgi:hypothetical protein